MMNKTVLTAALLSLGTLMVGCSDSKQEPAAEKKTYKMETTQVWQEMCVKCHGKKAQGNPELDKFGKPKGPALNDKEIYELKLAITDIKSGGLNQSSGTDHEIMEHNYRAIKKKGMDYDTDAMAEFIYHSFNIHK